MSKVIRWSPLREMMSMRSEMDRLFDEFMGLQRNGWSENDTWTPAVDVTETEDNFKVVAVLPGVKSEDLEITLNDNVLTIRGETRTESTEEGEKVYLRERRYGSFMRSLRLPTAVNADGIEAHYENGELHLTVPKAPEAKPIRIAVQGGTKVIEG